MKFLPVLRTKQELYAYYLPEYSLRALRVYIADIIQQYRRLPATRCKNISYQEYLTFVALYGTPTGYTISPQVKEDIQNRGIG